MYGVKYCTVSNSNVQCHPYLVSFLFISSLYPSLFNSKIFKKFFSIIIHTRTHPPLAVSPIISSLTYQEASRTLTCVSTGSPPTVVEWMKNGQPLTINGFLYSLSQTVTDRTASTYNNTLSVSETAPGGVAGTYTCTVSNELGSANMSVVAVG